METEENGTLDSSSKSTWETIRASLSSHRIAWIVGISLLLVLALVATLVINLRPTEVTRKSWTVS